jgi:hypothetical protein
MFLVSGKPKTITAVDEAVMTERQKDCLLYCNRLLP